jgi:glycosyltransferase involved in cell wall biosynthesis
MAIGHDATNAAGVEEIPARASQSPRLTIVIPTLNRAALVSRAIESALAQTCQDIEIIVSNNGSTDETRRVLERYALAPRLRLIHRDVTIPATEHGSTLVQQARGEFFLGLSDDDWLEPEFAAKVLALFDRRPGLSFVWTGCVVHYGDAAISAHVGPEVESGSDFLAAFLAGRRNVCWCACVTRTSDLRRIGPIPADVVCGDMYYWIKLAASGDVGCVTQPVSHYVSHSEVGDGVAGGTPVLTWARETDRWVRDILTVYENAEQGRYSDQELKKHAVAFLSRSTANQFVWQAMRGERRLALLNTVMPALPYLRSRDVTLWIRIVASICAPRWLLRNQILAAVRRRAQRAGGRI